MSNQHSDLNYFILDSGASSHLVGQELEPYMTNIKLLGHNVNIHVANGQVMCSNKIGTLNVFCQNKNISIEALIVPNLNHNLLAISRLTEKGFKTFIDKEKMSINMKNCKLFCTCDKGPYSLFFEPASVGLTKSEKCFSTVTNEDLWHCRLGHLNRLGLIKLGLPYSSEKCASRIEGKATRLPFKKNPKRTAHIGQLIHSDICGPVNPATHDGKRYFQVIKDDYSHFTVVNLSTFKNEAEDNLINYVRQIEAQHSVKVQRIRVDNGGEVTSKTYFARSNGIRHEYTLPYSPQSNGKSERMNRTLLNMVRTKLAESSVPKELWGEALRCSAYELNRCPSTVLDGGTTPCTLWYGEQTLKKLRVFGCQVWYTCIPKGNKLDPRAKSGTLIGYCGGGYRIWDHKERKVILSRDVVFDENNMYFRPTLNKIVFEKPRDNLPNEVCHKSPAKQKTDENDDQFEQDDVDEKFCSKSPSKRKTTRPIREKKPPTYLQEYDAYNAYCLLTSAQPKTYEEAAKSEEWKVAIDKELKSHDELGTWDPAILPQGQMAMDLKWVFNVKCDGTKKARLVAKGFQQPTMFDELTYAPVCRTSTLRILLSQAVNNDWPLKQIDVPAAFLNGSLKEDVYIKRPEGVKDDSETFKLKRALYGLRGSPKCWNDTFNETIEKFGLLRSKYDFCLYSAKGIYLLLFVDDAVITGDKEKIDNLISYLYRTFKVKDL